MPKYIKLFENFVSEAAPFPFDPAKTALTGAKLHSDGLYYAIYPEGRIYIPTKETESLKKLPTNIMVTLDKRSPAVVKALTDMGGQIDQKTDKTLKDPDGKTYQYLDAIHFSLTDPVEGDKKLVQISNILSGKVSSSSGTSGTAGTAGTSGKDETQRNLTDELFGTEIATLFRNKIASVTGDKYDPKNAAASIAKYDKIQASKAHATLMKNDTYKQLMASLEKIAKDNKIVDFKKGTTKEGTVVQAYLDTKNKVDAMLASEIK